MLKPDSPATPVNTDLNPDACYTALLARDARFDGRWFVGVTSTGIYCRPVCRVRTPMRKNCQFYASAALAEANAFRPCMKCRPELAPKAGESAWSVMDASRTLARQAAEWLDGCDDAEASVEHLADRLGISSRHLRRIFMAEHGVSPLQYLLTRRLLLAKHLLTDSDRPVGEIALACGFGSQRRFNTAFVNHYRMPPTALRRADKALASDTGASCLRLSFRQPYDVMGLLSFLAPRAVPGVEQVDVASASVQRSVAVHHAGQRYCGHLRASFNKRPGQVEIELSASLWPAVASLLPLLRAWLDLDADPQVIAASLAGAAQDDLASSASSASSASAVSAGLRLPGCLDRYELAVRAVLGQQVTVAAARTLAARFVNRFGETLEGGPAGVERLFPSAERMAQASPEQISELGIIRRRAESILELARRWPTLAYARKQGSTEDALAELQSIAGIGPWTAHYMLMRGWSWPDAFPPGDVILRQQLSRDQPQLLSPKAYLAAAETWRPFRSYAVLLLWRQATLAAAR
ncbi:Ada metal-binding domain-containing protein [Paucibacter sp. AS339]|uniref:Ada metal-binding domain-containing protein n=1 Tax=Paucibacter hankyongi TaxID=3133434 RepID=UPI00309A2DEF